MDGEERTNEYAPGEARERRWKERGGEGNMSQLVPPPFLFQ